jgi:hypothetical protein
LDSSDEIEHLVLSAVTLAPPQGTYRTSDFLEQSRDRYPLSGTKMGLQLNQKYWGVSCDEIIMANEYRKSLMSLV